MTVLNTFPFAEPHELDLLVLKVQLEAEIVDEWVIVENAYSFQGELKGLHANRLIQAEPRLAEFLHRISVIEASRAVRPLTMSEDSERSAFLVEAWQRDLAWERVADRCSADDWVIVSDVDEMIDSTDPSRLAELRRRMQESDGYLGLHTLFFWYDFDNVSSEPYAVPMATRGFLEREGLSLSRFRRERCGPLEVAWDQTIGFHYSGCFPVPRIERKLRTQSHTGISSDELHQALRANHRPMSKLRSQILTRQALEDFETVVLDRSNSPALVRDHLADLRTGNVDPDYRSHRRQDYPALFRRSHRHRVRISRALRWIRAKAIFAVRHLGWWSFKLEDAPAVESPWLDD